MKQLIKAIQCSLFCVISSFVLYSQDFNALKKWHLNNINYKINNSNQIKPIRDLYSKYDLLILAESTHYDGATIDAQCMIMKELIDSGVINTIYTESSSVNAEAIMAVLLAEGNAGESKAKRYATSGELIYWIENGFWSYLKNKIIDRKVRLVGFDIETNSSILVQELFEEIQPVIVKHNLLDSLEVSWLKEQYSSFDHFVEKMVFPENLYHRHCNFINIVKSYYGEAKNKLRLNQWTMIESYFYWIYHRQFSISETTYAQLYSNQNNIEISYFNSIRDSIMAKILICDYYANQGVKAIIKTSSYHALSNFRTNSLIEGLYVGKETHLFKETLDKRISQKIYSICFISFSGKSGLDLVGKKTFVNKVNPPKESLENYFKKCNYPFIFSDFQDSFDVNSSFTMNVVFNEPIKAKWGQIFSGVFFIRKMYPLKYSSLNRHLFE